MRLHFLGGAGEVTGSNYLLDSGEEKILIDCGLHQGSGESERKNSEKFDFDPKQIKAVFITHTHIDHIGRIPQLVKKGFSGFIYSTAPTKDAAYELLLDNHHLMERSDSSTKEVIYDLEDLDKSMSLWKTLGYHEKIKLGKFEIELYNSGHILGSACIKIICDGKTIVFSGDLGNVPAPLVKDTEYIDGADYALVESTYGNRIHESANERKSILEDLIEDTVKSGGTLLIPAFAMERTQELLYELNDLVENGRIPKVPIFIDSPLAIKLTSIYEKYIHNSEFFDDEAINLFKSKDEIFNFSGLKFTLTTEQSKEINNVPPPKVIIAGSGMSQGGRILHHEMRYLSDPKNTILFVGFQTQGSMGRAIIEGAPSVKIMGEIIPIRCHVKAIGGYSAHADQPLLLKWVESMKDSLKKVFVVQGELDQAIPLAEKIRSEIAVDAVIPKIGEVAEL
ncbi:MAG: MBL fold metallo-hydrolase [Candidatus Paceibacterota bacterium]|jgi:metallo-beta-lactamase family protein